MSLDDLFPSNDQTELFQLMDAREHWLILIVDFLPVTAIITALSKMMKKPPKSYAIHGLPPVIALPKKDISTKALASIMSTAGGGPIPEEALMDMLGDRDVILCAEPKSVHLGIRAMDSFLKLHRRWKTERYGIQLFFVTNRLYKQDYEEAIDFLTWLLAGIVCHTTNLNKTDVEVVTDLATQIWDGTTGAGQKKAQETAKALKTAGPHLEPSMKILELVAQDKTNKDRAVSVLNHWMMGRVNPMECADWAASNLGLCMTLLGGDFNGRIAEISEKLIVRIRDRAFATNLWVKQRQALPAEKRGVVDEMIKEMAKKLHDEAAEDLDADKKIEGKTDKPPKRR